MAVDLTRGRGPSCPGPKSVGACSRRKSAASGPVKDRVINSEGVQPLAGAVMRKLTWPLAFTTTLPKSWLAGVKVIAAAAPIPSATTPANAMRGATPRLIASPARGGTFRLREASPLGHLLEQRHGPARPSRRRPARVLALCPVSARSFPVDLIDTSLVSQ